MELTHDEIVGFHGNGFLAIGRPIATDAELAELRIIYDRMFKGQAGRSDGNQFDLAGADEDGTPASLPQIPFS